MGVVGRRGAYARRFVGGARTNLRHRLHADSRRAGACLCPWPATGSPPGWYRCRQRSSPRETWPMSNPDVSQFGSSADAAGTHRRGRRGNGAHGGARRAEGATMTRFDDVCAPGRLNAGISETQHPLPQDSVRRSLTPGGHRCLVCGIGKPCSEYHSHPKTASGLDHRCKACKHEMYLRDREWRARRSQHDAGPCGPSA